MSPTLKQKLKNGEIVVGTMIQDLVDPIIITILSDCGFDFVVVDQEHGPATYKDIQDLALAAKFLDIAIIIRPPCNSYEYMAKALDMGADGVMVPHVDTRTEAEDVVRAVKYPPDGNRSFGMRKTLSKLYQTNDNSNFIRMANAESIVFLQVENPGSAGNIDDLLSVPHVDGVIIGPADFTMSMGIIGQYQDPGFENHVEKVLESCKRHRVHFGIHFGDLDLVLKWKRRGMDILMYSNVKNLLKERCLNLFKELNVEKTRGSIERKTGVY
ncbi:MAG: HpcH/HpaI aldolase family protein [Promethearchaeota archaeon]